MNLPRKRTPPKWIIFKSLCENEVIARIKDICYLSSRKGNHWIKVNGLVKLQIDEGTYLAIFKELRKD